MNKRQAIHSLKTRLSVLMFLGMVLVSTLVVLGVYALSFQNAEHDAKQQVGELVDAMESSAAIALYAGDTQIAEDVVRGISRGSFVASAHLANNSGLNVTRSNYPDPPHTIVIQRNLRSPFDNQEYVGMLEVTLYPPEIRRRAADSAKKMAIALGGIVLVPTFLFWLGISRLLSTPLLKLSRQLGTIVPGTHQRLTKIEGHSHDELATLVDNINVLLDTVTATIRKKRRLRLHIEALEQQYEAIFTHAATGIALIDRQGRCLIANPAVSNLFEHWQDKIKSVFSLPEQWENTLFLEPDEFRNLLARAFASDTPQSQDLPLLRRSHDRKDWVHVQISCSPHPEYQRVAECLFLDVSDRKRIEDEARFHSHHDPLTLLLNRRGLEARLNFDYAARDQDRGTMLLLDLDRFKQINDQWGHLAGDKVLIEVARRMKTMVRGIDLLARLGGDEFLICLREQPGEQALHNFLLRMIDIVGSDIDLGDTHRDYVGASIGVAQYPLDGSSFDELLHKADAALYEVKHSGRNGYCIYDAARLSPVILARDDVMERR